MRNWNGWAGQRLGLILPASLCSAQVAVMAAERLNAQASQGKYDVSRFVALPHSEGCTTLGPAEALSTRTLLGYLRHPYVARAFVLEHGCEKTHNDYLRRRMREQSMDPAAFGWGSVQLDGGVEAVLGRIEAWASGGSQSQAKSKRQPVGLEKISVGITSLGAISEVTAPAMARWIHNLLASGATCLLPMNANLLSLDSFRHELDLETEVEPTLPYGGWPKAAGLHIMGSPTQDLAETLTGMGAAGVHVFFCCAARAVSGHPFIPTIRIKPGSEVTGIHGADLRLWPEDPPRESARRLMDMLFWVLRGEYLPQADLEGDTRFQLARGPQGLSL